MGGSGLLFQIELMSRVVESIVGLERDDISRHSLRNSSHEAGRSCRTVSVWYANCETMDDR
jgi:hypothetical protein